MFHNYLTSALRNLVRNRLYAAINIVGLAVGFAGAIFAALFVRYELTYNRWIPGYERTYTVVTKLASSRGAAPTEWTWAYRDMAAWMKLDFPEVEAAGRSRESGTALVRSGDISTIEEGTLASADVDFFSAIPLPVIAGDIKTALNRPDGVVLSHRMARKYFGEDKPLGRELEIDRNIFHVTAVLDDLPTNTDFPGNGAGGYSEIYISALAPSSTLYRWDHVNFGLDQDPGFMVYGGTFIRLKPGASIDAVQKALPGFIHRHIPPDLLGDIETRLLPIAELHPPSLNDPRYAALKARFTTMILGVSGIATLMVVAAAINYVNAVTARAAQRGVEVGVRKAAGAKHRQLIFQFIGETLLSTLFAAFVAVCLVSMLLQGLQGFLDRSFQFSAWRDPTLVVGLLVFSLAIGVLAGAYPAFVLSALRPAQVLKAGTHPIKTAGRLREILVTIQFAILIGVMVVAAVIYRQTDFAMNESLTFNKGQILFIRNACRDAMVAEIARIAGVEGTTCGDIRDVGGRSSAAVPGMQQNPTVFAAPVDANFFSLMGIAPLAGELFDETFGKGPVAVEAANNPDVVINASAARAFGFSSPAQAVGQTVLWRQKGDTEQSLDSVPPLPSRIVGVVDDISLNVADLPYPTLFYAAALPQMTHFNGRPYALTVKLTGRDVPQTLKAIDAVCTRMGDPNLPIRRQFMNEVLQSMYRDVTRQGRLIAALTVMAVFIAALGLFGLSAFIAERRTKEMGVRKALGANQRDILRLLLQELVRPVLWANVVAWPAAYFFSRHWLEGFARHIDLSAWVFIASSAFAVAVATITVLGRALIVARAQPVTALRYE